MFDDPFNFSPPDEEEQNWRSALVYTIGALLLLLLGFIGNGVFKWYQCVLMLRWFCFDAPWCEFWCSVGSVFMLREACFDAPLTLFSCSIYDEWSIKTHTMRHQNTHDGASKLTLRSIKICFIHEQTQTYPFTHIPWQRMNRERAYVQLITTKRCHHCGMLLSVLLSTTRRRRTPSVLCSQRPYSRIFPIAF